ncbi:hypothetical protein Tco_0375736 [Tanacetum coccineum]
MVNPSSSSISTSDLNNQSLLVQNPHGPGTLEELDSMNEFPRITNTTPEIMTFLNALNTQKEERRLFQFLNGLDDHFTIQRSQLLLNYPLPSVKTACALLQQEESQRGVFRSGQLGVKSTALYSKWK